MVRIPGPTGAEVTSTLIPKAIGMGVGFFGARGVVDVVDGLAKDDLGAAITVRVAVTGGSVLALMLSWERRNANLEALNDGSIAALIASIGKWFELPLSAVGIKAVGSSQRPQTLGGMIVDTVNGWFASVGIGLNQSQTGNHSATWEWRSPVGMPPRGISQTPAGTGPGPLPPLPQSVT